MILAVAKPLGDVESVTAAIAAALRSADFAQLLANVDAAENTGDDTPAPKVVYAYERAQLEKFPAAEVIALNTAFNPQADEAAGAHRILVDWTQIGDSEARITREVQRLVLATRLFFRRSVLQGDYALAPMTIEFEDYSRIEPLQNAPQPFLKGGRVVLVAETWSL